MKIGLYDQYFDSFGGGERYILTLSSLLSAQHEVVLFWKNANFITLSEKRFNLNLSKIRLDTSLLNTTDIVGRINKSRSFDAIILLTDGSLPILFPRKLILHVQTPFSHMPHFWWKKFLYSSIICNSNFTLTNMDSQVKSKAKVIYPPVVTDWAKPANNRSKIILNVGRFTNGGNAKRQDILIEAWSLLAAKIDLKGWKLVLAGGLHKQDQEFFSFLKRKADGLNIVFYPNIESTELYTLYNSAAIYWHAAGYKQKDPMKMEHFGISIVEAMAGGCIPIIYDAGGSREIIENGVSGYLYNAIDELLTLTAAIIDQKNLHEMKKNIMRAASKYSLAEFYRLWNEVI